MINIGLIFHSAKNPNLGVGALTVADVAIIREAARGLGAHITIIDGFGIRKPCIDGPDITVLCLRPMRKPWEFFRAVRGFDAVIDIGGGDSLADIYGWKRFVRMHLQKYLVHLAGRPLILAPQTFGPFQSRFFRAIAAGSIRRAALVVTRDGKSTAALQEMGISKDAIEASDVALRLPYTPAERPVGAGRRPRVGLNVSGLLMSGGYTRANMFGLKMDYPQLVRDVIARFQQHPDGCEVHLVPHVLGIGCPEVEDDLKASQALASEFPGVIVAPAFETPSEAKSYISGLDFFAGARMHSCIAAFSAGVAVAPMAYSRKFEGLFGGLGYGHTVDCTADSADVILSRLMESYENREVLALEAQQAFARGLDKLKLYEDALHAALNEIHSGR